MSGVNKATILGFLGRDPEIRYTQSGKAVCNFSVATTFKPKNGEEKTEWHNIVAWERTAEICGEYLFKGSQVFIEGHLQTSDWEGDDGKKRYKTEIVIDNMQMLGSGQGKKDESGNRPGQNQGQRQNNHNQPPADEDDIPF